jgi:PIN domain nuclease of toxin-antitoxin system
VKNGIHLGPPPRIADFQNPGVPIDAAVALRAGRFLSEHRDPFDRVIAAQALADDIPVLSTDGKLDSFGVRRIG